MLENEIKKRITTSHHSHQKCHSIGYESLHDLKKLLDGSHLFQTIKSGVLSKLELSIDDILIKFKNQEFEFNCPGELMKAILKEIVSNEHYKGEKIPEILHHFWAGSRLSPGALANLLLWIEQTEKNNWEHLLWTDFTINEIFNDPVLKIQFDLLSQGGIQIINLPEISLGMDKNIQTAYETLALKTKSIGKSTLPFISDLVRYIQLFLKGGVYVDVDVNPGSINLSHSFKHRNGQSEIPLLGPGFRTRQNAKISGYYESFCGAKEISILNMYNRHILGNHFIATKAHTDIIRNTISSASDIILSTKYRTSGVWNLISSIIKSFTDDREKIDVIIAQMIPPCLFDINWVSDESDRLVN